MIEIIHAHMPEQIDKVKSLFEQYAASIGFDLHFQNLEDELFSLPGEYVPPQGALFLAQEHSMAVGCVAMRPWKDKICEMKRLFVKSSYRGKGVGRLLVEAIIEEAKQAGYHSIRLDTNPSMVEAISLYQSVGFQEIAPYRCNPIPGALFFELGLKRR